MNTVTPRKFGSSIGEDRRGLNLLRFLHPEICGEGSTKEESLEESNSDEDQCELDGVEKTSDNDMTRSDD